MREEQSQAIMAVDELQAIIQRCVSSFVSIKVTSVSSVHFSSIIVKTKMTPKLKTVVTRTAYWTAKFSLHVSLTSLWSLSQGA